MMIGYLNPQFYYSKVKIYMFLPPSDSFIKINFGVYVNKVISISF